MRALVFLFLVCSWLISSPLYAQESPISAEVDRTALSTDSVLTLTVVVDGSPNTIPILPPLEGFEIVGSSTTSQMSIINGEATSQAIHRYILQPTYIGTFVIEPIVITIDNQTYSTEPIEIRVIQGIAPTPPPAPEPEGVAPAPSELVGQDFFVEAEVDNATPYVGQQVNYTFRFYVGGRLLEQPNYEAPDFTSFWNEQEDEQRDYSIEKDNRNYRVIELKTILFPTIVGERTIEPATLTLSGTSFPPLHTEPLTLTVQRLPSGAPADFNGAVGEFDIAASVDSDQVAVDEPVTLRLTLQGQGNIVTLAEPALPELADFRAFDRTSSLNTEVKQGILSGIRVDEQLLVPTEAGEFTIPPISYAFFDPETESYQTVSSEAMPITVLPGAEQPPVPTLPATTAAEPVTALTTDIRHIKTPPPSLSNSPPVTERLAYWLAWLVPFLLLLADISWQWGKTGDSSPSRRQRSQAHRQALALLSQASQAGHQHNLHRTISQALNGYLAEKLEQPVRGLTHDTLSQLLTQKGLDSELTQRVQQLLIQCDMGRFAPQATTNHNATALLKESTALINQLERSF